MGILRNHPENPAREVAGSKEEGGPLKTGERHQESQGQPEQRKQELYAAEANHQRRGVLRRSEEKPVRAKMEQTAKQYGQQRVSPKDRE